MKPTLLASGLILLVSSAALADPDFSTLEERMTGQEFRNTGLYKLTAEELAALNRWIRQRSLAEGEVMGDASEGGATGDGITDRRGLGGSEKDNRPIRSRIVGSFSGWEGNTTFELENGMVWQQTDNASFVSRAMENPEVEIKPGLFGGWYLRVDGYNSSTRVRRIR